MWRLKFSFRKRPTARMAISQARTASTRAACVERAAQSRSERARKRATSRTHGQGSQTRVVAGISGRCSNRRAKHNVDSLAATVASWLVACFFGLICRTYLLVSARKVVPCDLFR
jgi:hypothetical protein